MPLWKIVSKAGHIFTQKNAEPKDIEMRERLVLKYIELKINTTEDVEYEKIKDFLVIGTNERRKIVCIKTQQ